MTTNVRDEIERLPDAEIEALRQRLEEAEELNRAISAGEVDAFVIERAGQKRVLLLANAYQRYRELVERMQQGVLTITERGDILFANKRFARMLGEPHARLFSANLPRYLTPGEWSRVSSRLSSHGQWELDVTLKRGDGTAFPAQLALVSNSDGDATLVVSDLTPKQGSEKAENAAREPILDEALQQEFLASLAREVRLPLEVMRDAVDMLKRKTVSKADAGLAVEVVASQISRLARLADDLTTINRRGTDSR